MKIQSVTPQLLLQLRAPGTQTNTTQNNKDDTGRIVALVNQRATPNVDQSYFGRNPTFRPSFEFTAQYKSEDVFAQRNAVENRDVFEARPVYEEQAISETNVEGSRDLSSFDRLKDAGIKRGARFSITVGDGSSAVVKFVDARTISVSVDGSIQKFTFGSRDGSFRAGVQDALNSITGVTSSYTADGRLSLQASDANSLNIVDIAKSPLTKLGLMEGTTHAEVTGYQEVQIGTEQVKVGERSVVVGTETVKIGTRQVVDGYERVLAGLERSDMFNVGSLTAGLASDNSATSPSKYVELLFGTIPNESDSETPLVSTREAKYAYDEMQDNNHLLPEHEPDDARLPANKLPGWL